MWAYKHKLLIDFWSSLRAHTYTNSILNGAWGHGNPTQPPKEYAGAAPRPEEMIIRYGPPKRLKYLLRRGPCECMVEAVSPLFPYEYSLHNKPLILKLYYLEFLVFSILKSLKNMN